MTRKKIIISDQLRYEEDTAWQDWWENGEGANSPPVFDRMIEIDPNIKPWEEEYPYSRRIKEFEASKNLIVSTTFIEPSNTAYRAIAEGEFYYSPTNTLEGGVISNYHIYIKGWTEEPILGNPLLLRQPSSHSSGRLGNYLQTNHRRRFF